MLDQFVADNIPRFDLRDILPDFAGLSLDKLFKGVRIPSYANDAVKVTHGVNEQTRQAWARCDVMIQLSDNIALFEIGPVQVRLQKAFFEAHTSMTVSADDPGRIERSANAKINADWHLVMLGQNILMLEDCTLRYDNSGRLNFDLKPFTLKKYFPVRASVRVQAGPGICRRTFGTTTL